MFYIAYCISFFVLVSVKAAPNLRVIGGESADIKDFPYMVGIWQVGEYVEFLCGGTILDEDTILTAAHCTLGMQVHDLQVGYATSNWTRARYANVSRIISHSSFVYRPSWLYDISIIKLEKPIMFSENTQPIKLPNSNEGTPAQKGAILTGWGMTEFPTGDCLSNDLQKVNLTVYEDDECSRIYDSLDEPSIDTKSQFCAGAPGKGQCHCDSGGPLVIDGIQYGIVSFAVGCADKYYPGVYTKVSAYIDWISSHR